MTELAQSLRARSLPLSELIAGATCRGSLRARSWYTGIGSTELPVHHPVQGETR